MLGASKEKIMEPDEIAREIEADEIRAEIEADEHYPDSEPEDDLDEELLESYLHALMKDD